MSLRKTFLANDEIYHVFNRGVAKQPIFNDYGDYLRITDLLDYYRFKKPTTRFSYFQRLTLNLQEILLNNLRKNGSQLVEIITYCFMPNHLHLLLKQLADNGISTFMANFLDSYVRYFNTRHKRVGPLFQSNFKAVHIETNEQLLHTNRYIHLNPPSSSLVKIEELDKFQWSSLPYYLGLAENKFVNPGLILDQFKTVQEYRKFVYDQADYQKSLHLVQHLALEEI